MLLAIVWTPKGTSYVTTRVFETSRVKFHAWVASVGESGEKLKKNKQRGLIFHVFRQAHPYGWLAQILVTCSFRRRNQCCKVLS